MKNCSRRWIHPFNKLDIYFLAFPWKPDYQLKISKFSFVYGQKLFYCTAPELKEKKNLSRRIFVQTTYVQVKFYK